MTRLILIGCMALLMACGGADKKFDTETYEQSKESLEEKERKHPENFLVVTSTDKRNLIGQTVIKGSIYNKAAVCTYKDVQVKIRFFSKTGVLLEENTETIYEIIAPNSTVKFKTKYFAPKGTDNLTMTIIDAQVN